MSERMVKGGSPAPLVIVADDDPHLVTMMLFHLEEWGYRSQGATSKGELLRRIQAEKPTLVLLDLRFGEDDGLKVLEELHRDYAGLPVVMLTGHGSFDSAFLASKMGAADYLTKPPDFKRLRVILKQVVEAKQATGACRELSRADSLKVSRPILGESESTRQIRQLIARIAPTEASVLILGESGTGKELVARAIHEQSRRAQGPFIPVNMAALSRELVESELFGHERGSFTGAEQMREGYCQQADKGTLFLDEIGEMDFGLQPKLLRFLEERYFQRVGSNKQIHVDVRFVAATNRDPMEHIRRGLLREDLYYRLRGIEIRLPPLRDRREDIPILARRFLADAIAKNRLEERVFSEDAIGVLTNFPWPGNVRELLRVTEQLAILSPHQTIGVDDIWQQFGGARQSSVRPGVRSRDERDREMIVEALSLTRGNAKDAAKLLGIGYATVYRKIKKYNISIEERQGDDGVEGDEAVETH